MGNSRLTEERVDIIYKVAPIIIIITTIIITIIIIIIIIKEKRSFFIRQVHHGFEFVHRSIPFFESQTFPHCVNFVLVAVWWPLHLHVIAVPVRFLSATLISFLKNKQLQVIEFLGLDRSLQEEGIFRKNAAVRKKEELLERLEDGQRLDLHEEEFRYCMVLH